MGLRARGNRQSPRAEFTSAEGLLGASFFCSRTIAERSELKNIFPTLAFQLAHRFPDYRACLVDTFKYSPDLTRESLTSQLEKLIVVPFTSLLWSRTIVIIVDALDKCIDGQLASALLSVLARHIEEIPFVKFFITGRPESHIRIGFRLPLLQPMTEFFRLHDIAPITVGQDVQLYLRTKLVELAGNRSDCRVGTPWPSEEDITILGFPGISS